MKTTEIKSTDLSEEAGSKLKRCPERLRQGREF